MFPGGRLANYREPGGVPVSEVVLQIAVAPRGTSILGGLPPTSFQSAILAHESTFEGFSAVSNTVQLIQAPKFGRIREV